MMNPRRLGSFSSFAPLFAVIVATASVTACASKSTGAASTDPVDEGSDAYQAESDSESLGSSLVGGDSTSVSLASENDLMSGGTLALEDIPMGDGGLPVKGPGGVVKGKFNAACLTVTDEPLKQTATYVFNDCTGPYGLVHVDGTVVVTYASTSPTQLTLTFSATGLKINKATIDWSANADISANGAARDMKWTGKISGTTGKGRAFERTNTKEFKWTVGTDCILVNGESDGTVTGHELKTDVIDYNRCKRACPEAGSEIKITDVTADKVYDVKWNATNATYTGPDGKSVDFIPLCAL